jgi:hypothetical protein
VDSPCGLRRGAGRSGGWWRNRLASPGCGTVCAKASGLDFRPQASSPTALVGHDLVDEVAALWCISRVESPMPQNNARLTPDPKIPPSWPLVSTPGAESSTTRPIHPSMLRRFREPPPRCRSSVRLRSPRRSAQSISLLSAALAVGFRKSRSAAAFRCRRSRVSAMVLRRFRVCRGS